MTNGELPENRRIAVEAGLSHFQTVAAERDEWERTAKAHETTIAGYKVAMEAQEARVSQLESRAISLQLERDQTVADLAVYQTLFISIQSQLRAFQVPNAPLVRDRTEDEDALEAMQRGYGSDSHPANLMQDLINAGRDMPKSRRSEKDPSKRPPPFYRAERQEVLEREIEGEGATDSERDRGR